MANHELIPFEAIVAAYSNKQARDKHEFGRAVFDMNRKAFGSSTDKKPWREIESEDITPEILQAATMAFIVQISHGPNDPPSKERLSTLKRAYSLAGESLKGLVEAAGKPEADFPIGEKQFYFDCQGILDRAVGIAFGPCQPVWGTISILARKLGVYGTWFDPNASSPTE